MRGLRLLAVFLILGSGGQLLFYERSWAWIFDITLVVGLVFLMWDFYRNRKTRNPEIQTVFSDKGNSSVSR